MGQLCRSVERTCNGAMPHVCSQHFNLRDLAALPHPVVPLPTPVQALHRSRLSLKRCAEFPCMPIPQPRLTCTLEGCFSWLYQNRYHTLQVCAHSGTSLLPLIPAHPPGLVHVYTRGLFPAC